MALISEALCILVEFSSEQLNEPTNGLATSAVMATSFSQFCQRVAKRGIAIVSYPPVRPSVTLLICGLSWVTSKVIEWIISFGSIIFGVLTSADLVQRTHPKIPV